MAHPRLTLYHQTNHPNGFKVYLASIIYKKQIEVSITGKGIRYGAQLKLFESCGAEISFDANNAVLYLGEMEPVNKFIPWLQWELHLQGTLFPYIRSVLGKKEEKALVKSLASHLSTLDEALPNNGSYFFQELSVLDIILYGSLSLLIKNKNLLNLLKDCRKIGTYLKFLKTSSRFEECEKNYYKLETSKPELWPEVPSVPVTSGKSTWDLIKTKPTSKKEEVGDKKYDISQEKLKEANNIWSNCYKMINETKERQPILPVNGQKNTLVTSALPYVNNVPHLGNIIGCVLSADVFARFCRARGDNIIYICGTDEYGTATETKALAENLTPKQICDKYNAIHKEVYDWFNIKFDYFGRTTGPHQELVAHEMFWKIHENGLIASNTVEQLYCLKCSKFLADRFVEGICPHPGCLYEDARGDQCDKCGKLVNATDLKNPKCKVCSSSPEIRSSSHLFLDLPKIEGDIKKWLSETNAQWTINAKGISESWVRDGLKERCITRDLKWGTKVPLDGYTNKVFYVWYDAPLGYISMTRDYTNNWELWWKNPENVTHYEFMAKDNVPFHSIIFPACQIATGENWTKVNYLMATEYLNYEDGKFSKSRQLGVFGDQAKETGIPSDVWRFYLLFIRPEAQDTSFSWVDLQMKNNSELLNNLGNFINRALKFVDQFFKGIIPPVTLTNTDLIAMASINTEVEAYKISLSNCKLRDGIRNILAISKIGNQYIQENEPFRLVKPACSDKEKQRGASIIHVAANITALLAILLKPYMPETANRIFGFLNLPEETTQLPDGLSQILSHGHKINKPHPLIEKITDETIEKMKEKFGGQSKIENFVQAQSESLEELEKQVTAQGNKVRDMKSSGASKDEIAPAVAELLKLKKALAIAQGIDPATLVKDKKKNKKK